MLTIATESPTFQPVVTTVPNVTVATARITSPATTGCTFRISATLNRSQAAMTLIGTDTLPATACATLTESMASNGLTAVLADAPYGSPLTGTSDVTFRFTP